MTGEAAIDENGRLAAISEGAVELIATMNNYPSVDCTAELFILNESINPVLSIIEVCENLTVGVPYQLSASLVPDMDIHVLWSIDDDSKAIINQTTSFVLTTSSDEVIVTAKLYDNEEVFATKQLVIGATTSMKESRTSYF